MYSNNFGFSLLVNLKKNNVNDIDINFYLLLLKKNSVDAFLPLLKNQNKEKKIISLDFVCQLNNPIVPLIV